MAKIILKRRKTDKDTYLVRNVKGANGELEYDDTLLEEDESDIKQEAEKARRIEEENQRLEAEKARRIEEENQRLEAEKARRIEEENQRLEAEKARRIEEENQRLEAEKARRIEEEKAHMEELQREQVSANEVQEIVSDETANILIEKEDEVEKIFGNKKGIINIDLISRNFEAGDVVTIHELKSKKLIDKNIGFIKVLARGVIDKPLIIKAHDFSIDAAKMIQLTGGTVVLINKKKY